MTYPEIVTLLGLADAVVWAHIVSQSRPVREWAARRRCRATTREALTRADRAAREPARNPRIRAG